MTHSKKSQGLTLIEVLASIVIFVILLTVILAPLTNLFRRTAANTGTLQTTTQAQEVLEAVRGRWRAPPNPPSGSSTTWEEANAQRNNARDLYDRSCYQDPVIFPGLPAGTTVVIREVDRNGNAGDTLECVAVAPSPVPAIKRIVVTVQDGDEAVTLVTDVPRPPFTDIGLTP